MNDKVMMMDEKQEKRIVDSCIQFLGKGTTFTGTFTPTQQVESCQVHGTNNLLNLEK